MVMPKKAEEQYSDDELKRRFEAALKGARLAGHVPMKAKKKIKKRAKESTKKG